MDGRLSRVTGYPIGDARVSISAGGLPGSAKERVAQEREVFLASPLEPHRPHPGS
jgi:hypothetical protein